MKFAAYPRTKPSGVEWLGDVPEHWEVKRLGYVTQCLDGMRIPLNSEARSDRRGDYPYWGANSIVDHVDAWLFDEPLVLLGEDGAPFFERNKTVAFFVQGRIWVNNHAHVLRPTKSCDPRYLSYALNQTQFGAFIDGATRDKLTQADMNSIPVAYPPPDEQQMIAAFLDRETERFDRLMKRKRQLIARLKEQRTALISRTVTRGLPPASARAAGLPESPPLKPSGVEWIGDIPKHWDLVAYKRVCTRVDVGIAEAATHAYCDDGVPIIRSTNVKANKLNTSDVLRIEPWFAEKNRTKTLRAGDLVTVRTGYPGTTAAVPPEFDGCQCFTLVLSTPKRTAHGPFFSWVLNSNPGASYFEMEGWGTAQTNISVPIVRFMPVPRPPLPEQVAIAAYLDAETAKLDALVGKVEAAVERLQEYRTALITAAVTGKIDVRASVIIPTEPRVTSARP
ncbi:MAG: restriction endonuclease subunit S [Xanthomonadales bacterium]|nr:restriction endonuclease subunit S [Xanthomonadales bacterium]